MALKNTAIQIKNVLFICQRKYIHQSAVVCSQPKHGMKWRINQGMSRSGNEYGAFTDKPDYSFLDGRPTPLTPNQQRRRQEKIDIASDIMTQLGQMDFAKERFQLDEQAKQLERQTLLAQKLKPKS